jgi:hypothetical protein
MCQVEGLQVIDKKDGYSLSIGGFPNGIKQEQ